MDRTTYSAPRRENWTGARTNWCNGRFAVRLIGLALLAGAVLFSPSEQVRGQIRILGRMRGATTASQPVDGVFLPVDRETALKLERAKEMLAKGQVADAVIELDRILDRREDYFFKLDPNQTVHQSLKAEAQRLLSTLDKEQRAVYELQFGAQARRLLDEATTTGNLERLSEVVRRYFHTQAGYEAALVLARTHLDHDQPLAAALILERVKNAPAAGALYQPTLSLMLTACWLRAGLKDRASAELASIQQAYPGARLEAGGKPLDLGNQLASLAVLSGSAKIDIADSSPATGNWTMPGGNPARNASMAGGSPLLNERWSVSVFYSASLSSEMARLRKQFTDSGRAVVPSAQPLAVGNLVLMRTPHIVYGVDFTTGKLLWPWPPQPSIEEQANPVSDASYMQTVTERMWVNNTYGSMAADEHTLYLVHEGDIQETLRGASRTNQQPIVLVNGRAVPAASQATHNVLSAHSLRREGAIEWYVGGLDSEMEPELAGAFFLGAPLPLQDQLYVLAEMRGGINLVVLDAHTGKLAWMQQLAIVEQNLQLNPLRRTSGASPSYADGVLVCPTSAGAVVAVDLATRSLLWGYQYRRSPEQERHMQQRMAIASNGLVTMPVSPGSQWADTSAVIAEGRVLIPAVESDQLVCLSLLNGKEVWPPMRRDAALYVAAAGAGRLIVVRESEVDVLNAATGKTVNKISLGGSHPSGRGFYSGDDYYLPLTSAEVVKIDLSAGKITGRSRSRSGAVPGNLICHRGYVISQGVESLDKYFQLEPLRQEVAHRLAANPEDPEALVWRGEIALGDGNLAQAVDDLRKAFHFRPAADAKPEYVNRLEAERLRSQDLLVDALTASLLKDFSTNRPLLAELEGLVATDEDRATFLRVLASGLHGEHKTAEALDAYLKLAELKVRPEALDSVEADRTVQRERWIGVRLAELWKGTSAENRGAIDQRIAERLATADEPTSKAQESRADRLRKFIDTFAFHPLADEAREKLLSQLSELDSGLEREQLLMRLQASGDRQRAGRAVARLASLYQGSGREREAATYYRRLESDFADVVCLENRTGKEIAAALPADGEIRMAMARKEHWPAGEVKHQQRTSSAMRNRGFQPQWKVELRGEPGPFFAGGSVELEQASQLVAYDALGRESFRLLMNQMGPYRNFLYGQNASYAAAQGHLLVVNTGFQILAVNTLHSNSQARSVLWQEDVIDLVQLQLQQNFGFGIFQNPRNNNVNPWGHRRTSPVGYGEQSPAGMSVVIDDCVAIQRGRELSFVNALTGRPVWVRRNVPPASEVFGDDEVLIVAPGDNASGGDTASGADGSGLVEAMILRTRDGELLGTRKVPAADRRWATYGRRILTWQDREQAMRLVTSDVWAEKEIELGVYPRGSKGTIVGGDSVAVYDVSGKFVVHSLADGSRLMQASVDADDRLNSILVQRSNEQYLLLTNHPGNQRPGENIQPALNDPNQMDGPNNGLISGRIYAFDRKTGKSQWEKPAVIDLHGYVASQGSELPVLIFARHVHQRQQMKPSILCLDKRTGRGVYNSDDSDGISGQASSLDASADPEARTVTLQLPGQAIVLTFTDQPAKSTAPYQAKTEPAQRPAGSASVVGRLFRILGQAADELENAARKSNGKEAPAEQDQVPRPALPR
jgi:outer membrane protein assembly factor BamB/tetratricopeptide (TPR) repeat protein